MPKRHKQIAAQILELCQDREWMLAIPAAEQIQEIGKIIEDHVNDCMQPSTPVMNTPSKVSVTKVAANDTSHTRMKFREDAID